MVQSLTGIGTRAGLEILAYPSRGAYVQRRNAPYGRSGSWYEIYVRVGFPQLILQASAAIRHSIPPRRLKG